MDDRWEAVLDGRTADSVFETVCFCRSLNMFDDVLRGFVLEKFVFLLGKRWVMMNLRIIAVFAMVEYGV